MNQKIGTKLGVVIILIIAVTVGAFLWRWEKNQPVINQPQMNYNFKNTGLLKNSETKQEDNKNVSQETPATEEFPTVVIEPGVSLEEIIKQAIFKKFPDWQVTNYSVTVTIETNENNHAIGRFIYDNNQEKHPNSAEGIWFAAKIDNAWTLVATSYTGYWGNCQDFAKYKFPSDMTPDCWDIEKNILIDTTNQKRFYQDGFTKADKKELVQAYIDYVNKNDKTGRGYWQPDKKLYVKIDKVVGNYSRGLLIYEDKSSAGFYAVKQDEKWIVVYSNGQDIPTCDKIDPYKFPSELINTCYDKTIKRERANDYQ